MKRNILNIGDYRYLVDHYEADIDLTDNQYYAEFVMLRNFTIMNDIVHDDDIYIIERAHFNEFVEELKASNSKIGYSIAFPITNSKIDNYSNLYLKFNDSYNAYSSLTGNINESMYSDVTENGLGNDVYEIYEIKDHKLYPKKIKCNKFRIYHPNVKKNISAIIDICNFINGIHFHYLCKPISKYKTNSETEIKYNNESYSEYIDVYYPSLSDLFRVNEDGTYNSFYREDYNIIASTRNEKFINSILSNSADLEHSEMIGTAQIVPLNLLIQPYRIVEEYAANSEFNYDDNLANDEKIFVKLFLKNKRGIDSNNYIGYNISLRIFPYSYIDEVSNMYIGDLDLAPSTLTINEEFKFNLMSRLGFSDGIISVVSLFNYPNKSYFYNLYKDDETTSPVKEAYKYYNNVDDKDYRMFVNDEIEEELAEIDAITELTPEMRKTTKEVTNANYTDDGEILKLWKEIMKSTIVQEYEEEFGTPGNFLGFKIQIATDVYFSHIIYDKNIRVNFSDIDDFSFKLNGIFNRWENRPEKLIVRCSFYDKIIGTEIKSNLIIITKEWFKYLINNSNVYRLTNMSFLNKEKGAIDTDMKVVDLTKEKDNINFINTIKCIVNKKSETGAIKSNRSAQQIIFKPIFYKTHDLQNISIRDGVSQNIGINLSEYMTKVETFKMIISNKEYTEYGRNDLFVIFNIDAHDLKESNGKYNITNEDGTYISSGNWSKY